MTINKLANRIEELRKKRGNISQVKFAEMLNLSEPKTRGRSTVNNWEQGIPIKSDMILKICQTFDVSPNWLLGYSDAESTNEDIQITHKTTGLSEKAIQNIKCCNPLILSRLMESERFVAMIKDACALERAISCVEQLEVETAKQVPSGDLFDLSFAESDSPTAITRNSEENEIDAWRELVVMLRGIYDRAKIEKYDLDEAFSDLMEEVIPTRDIFQMAKKTLRERGETFGATARLEGMEE